jgi:hypothetical protein
LFLAGQALYAIPHIANMSVENAVYPAYFQSKGALFGSGLNLTSVSVYHTLRIIANND